MPWFNTLDFPLVSSFDSRKSNRCGLPFALNRISSVLSVEPLSTMITSARIESDGSNEPRLAINLCKLAPRLYVGTMTLMWGNEATLSKIAADLENFTREF
jgi:hypothetical protein